MKHILLALYAVIALQAALTAQNYHAIQGSSYAGALGVHNNPASIVNTPFTWDISVLGAQLKSSTNAFTIYNYSLISSPANSLYYINKGEYGRYANLNFNLNLFNTRIALNRKQSIAFGANMRSYTTLKTSTFNFIDTLHGSGDFFKINGNNTNFNASMISSSWLEAFITYSRTISDNEAGRLNAGITLKLNKGISGGYAKLTNGAFTTNTQNNRAIYNLTNANLVYAYSANYDKWKSENSASKNLGNFLLANTAGGASFDIGVEYLLKPQGTTSFYDDENYYDYDWKIGLSLLDIGGNQYKYGEQSRSISAVKTNISNKVLDAKFDSTISSIKIFNDSLATIVNQSNGLGGKFRVINPMRMVLNIDHYLYGNFFVNGEIVLNMPSSFFKKYMRVNDLNLVTITPRWETRTLGAYLPIQYNSNNQFWIGGAFKAGPLLIGVHNWASIFSKSAAQNGGGYVALIFRSLKNTQSKKDKKLDCPPGVW